MIPTPTFPKTSRPDPLDIFVYHWLQGAVVMAHMMTLPFKAARGAWDVPDADPAPVVRIEGEIPVGMGEPLAPSLVSPVRPEDVQAPEGGTETCADCRFFHGVNDDAGECRRCAPCVDCESEAPRACWPITMAKHWCGDFLLAQGAPARTALH